VRLAPEESPPRTDGEDHQYLRRNRLDEPAGLKKRLILDAMPITREKTIAA
jgi:hypothetical protein